jgi:hypothetical protein
MSLLSCLQKEQATKDLQSVNSGRSVIILPRSVVTVAVFFKNPPLPAPGWLEIAVFYIFFRS